jgi:succinate-semialdehyde dehydrogenase/glutarate-semialdehyde dehydrogenase
MASLKVGDPMDAAIDVGPLATEDVLKGLEAQVQKTIEMGARVLLGGKRIDRKGNFYAPTALTDIPEGSPAFDDELFGPVASLYRAKNMSEAIEIANNSIFGLGACAWTNDAAEREMFINEIESGLAFINGMVASDARIPFGGVKHSGFGRELSHHGIREFVNVKSVCIQESNAGKSRTE